jgi:sugar/nucleoside kinase (ribokinase family)
LHAEQRKGNVRAMPLPHGFFAGLATLDTAYRVAALPGANSKVVALGQELAAGGPAAGAAVTFAALGGSARLLTALGGHVLARYAASELARCGVEVRDATPQATSAPAVSSVYVVDGTGERSVVSVNATGVAARVPADVASAAAGARVVLIDGHHLDLALAAARAGVERGVPVVLDGGSWKDGLEAVLPLVDVAVCSADFRTPGAATAVESVAALRRRGVPAVAVTRGAAPVWWWSESGSGEVPAVKVAARDTLGAGDAFHGAFCYAMSAASGIPLPRALAFAAEVAAVRCRVAGLRAWLSEPALRDLAGGL